LYCRQLHSSFWSAPGACRKSVSTIPAKVKSATVTFKATAAKTVFKSIVAANGTLITVKGGTIDLTSAWIYFGQIDIQEDTGNESQQTGGADHKSSTETEANDSADIYLPGPYAFNVLSDTITLSNVQVYPGTFKKVELTFIPKNDTIFDGNSIVIKGWFTAAGGSAVPVVLQSKFAQQIELKLAKGITVTANSKVSLSIVFNLNKWLNTLDLTTATQTSGVILIDATHNQSQLKSFEAALSDQGADLNEEKGGDSGSDSGSDHSSEGGND